MASSANYSLRYWGKGILCLECFIGFSHPETLEDHINLHELMGGKNVGELSGREAVVQLKANIVTDALSDRSD